MTGPKYDNLQKASLISIAGKIKKIPKRFSDSQGNLDLDKVHFVLMEYQRNKLIPKG